MKQNRMKRVIAKAFGFDKALQILGYENSKLKQKVKTLGWCNEFGMFTRPALEEACNSLPRGSQRFVIFLDMDDLHRANELWGYETVNEKIRRSFQMRRQSDIVGRWYSGDEILLVMDTNDREGTRLALENLLRVARQNGLSFTYAIGLWEKDQESIVDLVSTLSTQVQEAKKKTSLRCVA